MNADWLAGLYLSFLYIERPSPNCTVIFNYNLALGTVTSIHFLNLNWAVKGCEGLVGFVLLQASVGECIRYSSWRWRCLRMASKPGHAGCAAMAFVSIATGLVNIWTDIQRMRSRNDHNCIKSVAIGNLANRLTGRIGLSALLHRKSTPEDGCHFRMSLIGLLLSWLFLHRVVDKQSPKPPEFTNQCVLLCFGFDGFTVLLKIGASKCAFKVWGRQPWLTRAP